MGRHYCYYCDVNLTHDSTSGKRSAGRGNTVEERLADSITYNKVRKAHDTGRNHLQNVRDYYLSLDVGQNEAIFAKVLQEYEKRGLPPPVFVYNPPVSNNYSGERSGGRGGYGGGGRGGFGRGGFGGGGRPPYGGGGGGGGGGGFGYNRPPPNNMNGPPGYGGPPRPPPGGQYGQPPPNMGGGGPAPMGMRPPSNQYNQPPPGYR